MRSREPGGVPGDPRRSCLGSHMFPTCSGMALEPTPHSHGVCPSPPQGTAPPTHTNTPGPVPPTHTLLALPFTSTLIITAPIAGHVGHAGPWAGRLLPGSVPSRPSAPGCRSEWPRGRLSAHVSAHLSPAPSCFTEDPPRHGEGQKRAGSQGQQVSEIPAPGRRGAARCPVPRCRGDQEPRARPQAQRPGRQGTAPQGPPPGLGVARRPSSDPVSTRHGGPGTWRCSDPPVPGGGAHSHGARSP